MLPSVISPSLLVTFVSIVMSVPRVIVPDPLATVTAALLASSVVILPFKVTPSLPVIVTVLISGVPAVIAPTVTVASVPSEVPAFKTTSSASVPLIAASVIGPLLELTVKVPSVSFTFPPVKVIASSLVVKVGDVPVKLIESAFVLAS